MLKTEPSTEYGARERWMMVGPVIESTVEHCKVAHGSPGKCVSGGNCHANGERMSVHLKGIDLGEYI